MGDVEAPPFAAASPDSWAETVHAPPRVERAWGNRAMWLVLAGLAYIPLFLSKPGMVAADTKQYLYLDPGQLLRSAASMWDPNVGMGTVTHQNIGYLFPMGPFYWVFHQVGVPTWVAQRLWMGSILLAAGLGVMFVGKLMGLRGPGLGVAALAYMLSPYIIDYIGRISAILLPWAGLGWMIGLVMLALRREATTGRGRRWRYPALFALVVAIVGGVNATSLLYAGLAPVLMIAYMVWITREVTWRRALVVVARIAVLTVAVSVWWAVGLWAQGSYGLNVLKYTETVPTVAITSLASEVVRGLGYWYFYGQDKLQPWTLASTGYTQVLWVIAVSFALPALAVGLGLVVRWRYRAYLIALVVLGAVLAVGTYPYAHPSPLGAVLKAASNGSTVGLAMRSSNRAVPLVALGLALLLGGGLAGLCSWWGQSRWSWTGWRWTGLVVTGLSAALVLVNLTPLWEGSLIASNLDRPSQIPSYWYQATSYLDHQSHATRVLELPGEDFAAYRWGVTEDPVATGLMTRPSVIRQVVPYGEVGSVNLLNAFDGTLQGGVFEPSTLAPIAALMSAGQVLLESDHQYERFNTPRPKPTWALFSPAPPGIGPPVKFGTPGPTPAIKYPLIDETALAQPPGVGYPPPLAAFPVANPRPIVRTETAANPLVVAGDGSGLVDASALGLLAGNPTILYAASLKTPAQFGQAMAAGADLVLTDTNKRQGLRWGSLRENTGYVEQAGSTPLVADPSNASLDVFAGSGDAAKTVAQLNGVASVQASAYGNPVTYTPENRPSNALDGNPKTAWTVGAFSSAVGEYLDVSLSTPVTADHITLLQPQSGPRNRHVTQATLRFDGRDPMVVNLDAASLGGSGQLVKFPTRSFSKLQIVIDATSSGRRNTYDGQSGVGFAEVGIPKVTLNEVLRLPTALLARAGTSSINHRLIIVMTRVRAPNVPPRSDPELNIARTFSLPGSRTFGIGGTARISAKDSDALINQLLGFGAGSPSAASGSAITAGSSSIARSRGEARIVGANSSSRLPGDLKAWADAAVDGNPATAWTPGLGSQAGNWLSFDLSHPITFDHLNLSVLADRRHSVPTRITVATENGSATVRLPAITDSAVAGTIAAAPVSFPALTGSHVKITIDDVRPVTTLDYYSDRQIILPVSLAAVGLPGTVTPELPNRLNGQCRSDLLTIDGRPVDIAVNGTSSTALSNGALAIAGCGNSANGITLGPGRHVVRTSDRLPSGISVDRLSMSSERGGAALMVGPGGQIPMAPVGTGPPLTTTHQDRTHITAHVNGTRAGFWLVLGESQNRGWKAAINGHSLGPSQLIDGYANGWYVPAGMVHGPATVEMNWAPQKVVWVGLVISGLALILCALLALWPRRRERAGTGDIDPGEDSEPAEGGDPAGMRAPVWSQPARGDSEPLMGWWPQFRPRGPSWRLSLAAALAGGVVAGAVSAPAAGLLVAALVFVGLMRRRWRGLLGAGAVGLFVATGAFMVIQQAGHRYVPTINWPGNFGPANTLAWLGLVLLGADALVEVVGHRRHLRVGDVGGYAGESHDDV